MKNEKSGKVHIYVMQMHVSPILIFWDVKYFMKNPF